VSRSQRRDTALAVLRTHEKAGSILPEDVPKFEMLIRRCRTPEEHGQVMFALNHYLDDLKTAPDRYARLLRDDLGLDDEAEEI
jgi:hypothetical protein